MRFSIDQKILENVLNYLASKPYGEVVNIIGAIQMDIKEEVDAKDNINQN